MDIEQTEIHFFGQFYPLSTNFLRELLDVFIFGHFGPKLGQDCSKIDPKYLKTHYQAYRANQNLFSSSHEKQSIIILVKLFVLSIEALK